MKPSAFVAGFDSISGLKTFVFDLPQLVFVGRSNVGKSSLINAILGRRNLAITSKTPGRTRQVNVYHWDEKVHIIDLPGYGYASVSKAQQKTWQPLMRAFFATIPPARQVYVLIDGRHGPKDSDSHMVHFLNELEVPYTLVFTKTDKVSQEHLKTFEATIQGPVYATSAKKKQGLEPFQAQLQTCS